MVAADRTSLGLVALLLLAGCTGQPAAPVADPPPPEPRPATFGAAVDALAECPAVFGSCYEPSIAIDAEGRVFVTEVLGDHIALREDGGASFRVLPAPPLPEGAPPGADQNDAYVQVAPDGRLFFSAMVQVLQGVSLPVGNNFYTAGFHVASSADAGATWTTNAWVALQSQPDAAMSSPLRVDRQWLSFDPEGRVYLSYLNALTQVPDQVGLWLTRSDDGGATFEAPRKVWGPGIGGPPTFSGRRLLLPFFGTSEGSWSLLVGRSDDGGASFETSVVAQDDEAGAYFPVLAVGEGHLLLAWWNTRGQVSLARSVDDGVTWSTPTEVSEGVGSSIGPWILARPDGWDLAYFNVTSDDGTAALQLLRAGPYGVARSIVEAGIPRTSRRPGNSDFAHLTSLPDGRLAAVWAHGNEAVRVAFEAG